MVHRLRPKQLVRETWYKLGSYLEVDVLFCLLVCLAEVKQSEVVEIALHCIVYDVGNLTSIE
jgi:hypothetical protein